ncbi:hypothetical protein LBMAG56_24130 [Verrucomicrobiota bacterium]|nr:hypothetical protein LBMAG56_24130 [Verrucomicrobiota bacterium]
MDGGRGAGGEGQAGFGWRRGTEARASRAELGRGIWGRGMGRSGDFPQIQGDHRWGMGAGIAVNRWAGVAAGGLAEKKQLKPRKTPKTRKGNALQPAQASSGS